MFWVISGFVLLYGLWLLLQPIRMWLYLRAFRLRPSRDYKPRVAIVVPCWNICSGFEDNMRSLLAQEYPQYRVVFVTGTTEDPAWPILHRLASQYPGARLVTSGTPSNRSQKLHNSLRALEEAGDVEVYVFADSDIAFPTDWLANMVAPLRQPDVGATTGCFWLEAADRGLWSQALAWAFNTLVVPFFAGERLSLAWGGSMAIRASTFRETGIANAWRNAAYDDLTLAECIKRHDLRLLFVPQALLAAPIADQSLRWAFDWLKRQMIAIKVYSPGLYWLGILLSVPNLLMAISPLLLLPALIWTRLALPALMLLGILPIRMVTGALFCLVMGKARTARYAILDYPAVIMGLAATYTSILSRRFDWGELSYELLSPQETRVNWCRARLD